jgi:hypothetical protein
MSWVKEAFSRGEEERRQAAKKQEADDLIRAEEQRREIQTKTDVIVQQERERQEEVARLKRLLDERGATGLLTDIQRVIGGDIIFKNLPFSDSAEGRTWAAYGLIKQVVEPSTQRRGGGKTEIIHYDYFDQGDFHVIRDEHRYHKFYRETLYPITVTKITLGASHFHPWKNSKYLDSEEFYVHAMHYRDEEWLEDIYTLNEFSTEIPLLLRFLPRAPGIVEQKKSRRNLLPDGKINPESLSLAPDSNVVGTLGFKMEIGESPNEDRVKLQQLLAGGLKGLHF